MLQSGEHGAASFSWSGNDASWRVWIGLGKGERGVRGWGTQCWELVEEKFLLRAKWAILHIIAIDFEFGYVCLHWILQSCVGGGRLGIFVRLGLTNPLRTRMGSVVGSSRHHTGTACWISLVLEVSLEQTALWSPLMFLKHSCYWEYSVEMLKLSITRRLTWESVGLGWEKVAGMLSGLSCPWRQFTRVSLYKPRQVEADACKKPHQNIRYNCSFATISSTELISEYSVERTDRELGYTAEGGMFGNQRCGWGRDYMNLSFILSI